MNPANKKTAVDLKRAREFVTNVERLLDQNRWTYAELAVRMGVTRPIVYRMVEGKQNPTDDVLGRVAEAFGVKVSDLFGRPAGIRKEKSG